MRWRGRRSSLAAAGDRASHKGAPPDCLTVRNGRTLFTSEPGTLWRIDLTNGGRRALEREVGDGWHYTYGDLGVSGDGRWLTGVMSMMSGTDFAAFNASSGSPAAWR